MFIVVVGSNIGVDICTHVLFEKVESKINSMNYQRQRSFTAASYCSCSKLRNPKRKWERMEKEVDGGWKGNELKRTWMEKVLDRKEIIRKGNQLFLEEYFSLDGISAATTW